MPEEIKITMEPITVGLESAAELLSVSRSIVFRWAKRADFPSFKKDGRVLVNVAGLKRWADAETERAQAEREATP